MPLSPPTQNLSAGGTLTAVVQFGTVNYSGSSYGVRIQVPSVFANFPLSSGGTAQLYFAPYSFSVTQGGWLNATSATRSAREPGGLQFSVSSGPLLSTEKIAVQGNSSYASLTLEVRWHWVLTQPNGSVVTGGWSIPSNLSRWPAEIPSEFYPAPYVSVLSTNGPVQTIGHNFTATLGGIVASRYFFLELESATSGKVVQDHGGTASPGVSATTVSVVMLNYNRYLSPSTYLVHVHDACGALLLSLSERAVYAPSANVTINIQPSSCGKVTFNGTGYANGSVVPTRPATTPYPFSLPACSGRSFSGWRFTGGLYPYYANRLLVSSSGTVLILYT